MATRARAYLEACFTGASDGCCHLEFGASEYNGSGVGAVVSKVERDEVGVRGVGGNGEGYVGRETGFEFGERAGLGRVGEGEEEKEGE